MRRFQDEIQNEVQEAVQQYQKRIDDIYEDEIGEIMGRYSLEEDEARARWDEAV